LDRYHVFDNVEEQNNVFTEWEDVINYAKLWCERLNEENQREHEPYVYNVSDTNGIKEIFEVCNISLFVEKITSCNKKEEVFE